MIIIRLPNHIGIRKTAFICRALLLLLPVSSDPQCSSPNRQSDCPYHRYVRLFDPTSFGICPGRFAADSGPEIKDLLAFRDGFWAETHVNRQFLHILGVHIAVHGVVLLQIAFQVRFQVRHAG